MSHSIYIQTIRDRFISTFDPSLIVVFEDEAPVDQSLDTWARLTIRPTATRRRTLGIKTYEVIGRVYLQIFTPLSDTAAQRAWTIADGFIDQFQDWSSTDFSVRFDTADTTSGVDDQKWFTVTVSVPFTAV